ncbi:MAG: hypothetical protein ACLP6G_22200 [Terriglobales bacterium]
MNKLHIKGFGGKLFRSEQGQGVAEYAAMLGVLLGLLIVVRAVGYNANQVFQWVVASMQ